MVAVALVAGCSGASDPAPDPTPSVATSNKCGPTRTPQAGEPDILLADPNTCETVMVGEIAKAARTKLERDYKIEVLLPHESINFTCTADGGRVVRLNGKTTDQLGFCNKQTFVISLGGLNRLSNGSTKIVGLWYIIGVESAQSRFPEAKQQVCAMAYIAALRQGANHPDDLEFYKKLEAGGTWREAAPPWQYALHGQNLAIGGMNIAACAKPMPEEQLRPTIKPSTTESGRVSPAALRLARSTLFPFDALGRNGRPNNFCLTLANRSHNLGTRGVFYCPQATK